MHVKCIDLVQFHWWDYNNPYYIDSLKYLSELREEGKVKHLGLTNFDTERMEIMKDTGLQFVTNQVQYSIIDRRPEEKMKAFCKDNNVTLLAYGTLCGGLVSEKYLGKSEPTQWELDTLSLKKYKRMIDQWGGWRLFQELLEALSGIAREHGSSIANVATRYILDKPVVAGVIIGTRLGITQHRSDNSKVFRLSLGKNDLDRIEAVCDKSNDLFELIGDCGDEYR
jgi:aryl-alcohol dehydrogenase-like predicted oxidoreductase